MIKHCVIPNKAKTNVFVSMAFGGVKKLCFQHPKVGVKEWQCAFERFGGKQFRAFFLPPGVKTSTKVNEFYNMSDEDIKAGFDYIPKNAPRSTADLRQLAWQTKALRKGAPLHGWPVALAAKALSGIAAEGSLAKEAGWHITRTEEHFKPWVLDVIAEIMDPLGSLVLIGEPNFGKTPLGRSCLFALCRRSARIHQLDLDSACVRATPEINFLRGEPGSLTTGDLLDDGSLNQLPSKMAEALLDVGQFEYMRWARWGATRWVKGEPRAIADQVHDPEAVKHDSWPSVKFQDFFNLVRPAFHEKATRACVMAFMKRGGFFVNTKTHAYWRAPGTDEADVQRKSICSSAGDLTPPPNKDAPLQKERAFVENAFRLDMELSQLMDENDAAASIRTPSPAEEAEFDLGIARIVLGDANYFVGTVPSDGAVGSQDVQDLRRFRREQHQLNCGICFSFPGGVCRLATVSGALISPPSGSGSGDVLMPSWFKQPGKRGAEIEGGGGGKKGGVGDRSNHSGGGNKQERLQQATSKLVLVMSRELADLSSAVFLKYEVLASGGLVAACQQAGREYDQESKELREKTKSGEKVDFRKRGPPHVSIVMGAAYYGAAFTPSAGPQQHEQEELKKRMVEMWGIIRQGEMLTVAKACPYFRLRIFRKEEGTPQKGVIYMTFHRDVELGQMMATLFEKLVIAEGGVYLPGPAPRGPLDREVSSLIGSDRK
ncbi:unnamed protein product [Prorocentrum cordatum]|uniref:Uncharacterized protein n=1 Tax=Prorocentrum cordatum TaxID=2364126 RepID=A0ABN9XB19_9DINO|nr:unnamed protein product [Polarella glacialis]